MKKVTIVVMDKEKDDALEKIRSCGVLHVETHAAASAKLTSLLERKSHVDTALDVLRSFKPKDKNKAAILAHNHDTLRRAIDFDVVDDVVDLFEKRKALQDHNYANLREIARLEKWGAFNPAELHELAEKGIVITPYEISKKMYANLVSRNVLENLKVLKLGEDKDNVYFATIGEKVSGESPLTLPEFSTSSLQKFTTLNAEKIAAIDKELSILSGQLDAVKAEQTKVLEAIEFESAKIGMEAIDEDDVPSDLGVSWVTGFVPASDVGLLKRAAASDGWALYADDPSPDDTVPTKLKNNKVVSLLYPLVGFLDIVPGYNEVDVSGWFLLFFTLFFGMIFGDAGYGLLILAVSLIFIVKNAKGPKGVPPVFLMLGLFAVSNVLWGVLTCSWFGVDASLLPAFFRSLSLPLISTAAGTPQEVVDKNLMTFCFSIALSQLTIAHIMGIVGNIKNKSLKFLSDVGQLAMLWGMYDVVISLVVNGGFGYVHMPMMYLLIGGFGLVFVFGSYEGSIGKSIFESVKNIISVILGITNVFSDIMSYIRLWAVGLAGASIAQTVNTMASPMLSHLAFAIFGVVLFGFGHCFNMVLNVLSVLVHGVRLNTLEFSTHVGLGWSGFAYKPFAKRS